MSVCLRDLAVSMTLALALAGCASPAKKTDASKTSAANGAVSDTNLTPKTPAHRKRPAHPALADASDAGASSGATQSDAAAGKAALENSPEKSEGAKSVTCKAGADERKLDIVSTNGGCKLNYEKEGAAKEIATQQQGDTKCQEVLDRVAKKLGDAGFECK